MEMEEFHNRYIPEPNTGCWLWDGPNIGQYGFFSLGQERYAHRVSYTEYNGEIPRGMKVCHSCDQPMCVNPDHLWLGTQRDNMLDMHAKGRNHGLGPNGERARTAKLTDDIAREILRSSESGPVLAEKYGVTRATINKIKRRETWRHVQ